jgi:hypothetical protein
LVAVLIAIIGVPILLFGGMNPQPKTLSQVTLSLLWFSGVTSGFTTLIALAAAAYGMDTRVPWGLDIYPYLIPALGLPSFLLLRIFSITALSRLSWVLTVSCSIAWYLGDKAERVHSGLRPITDQRELVGTALNAFTLLLLAISILLQLAGMCRQREVRLNLVGHTE